MPRDTHQRRDPRGRRAAGRPAVVGFMTAGFPDRASFREQPRGDRRRGRRRRDRRAVHRPDGRRHDDPAREPRGAAGRLHAALAARGTRGDAAAPAGAAAADELSEPAARLRARQAAGGGGARPACRASSFPTCRTRKAPICARRFDRVGVALVQMVTPVTPRRAPPDAVRGEPGLRLRGDDDRHHRQDASPCPRTCCEYMDRVRAVSPIPVCAGFGIRSARAGGAHAGPRRRRRRRLGAGRGARARRGSGRVPADRLPRRPRVHDRSAARADLRLLRLLAGRRSALRRGRACRRERDRTPRLDAGVRWRQRRIDGNSRGRGARRRAGG